LEEVVGTLFVDREVPEFIDVKDVKLQKGVDFFPESSARLSQIERFDQFQGGKAEDFEPGINGFDRDGGGQVSLANSGWPDKDNVFAVVDKGEIEETVNLLFGDGGLKGEIEFLEMFTDGEPGAFEVVGNPRELSCTEFMGDHLVDELEMGPVVLVSLAEEFLEMPGEGIEADGMELSFKEVE
jgi:hypothetical protein